MQKLAIEYFLDTRLKFPDKTAIVEGEQSITFYDLWTNSLSLAYWIISEFRWVKMPVVVHLPKSIDAVIAMLAIQLSGNIYVPLDIDSPKKRKNKIMDSLGNFRVLEKKCGHFTLADQVLIDLEVNVDVPLKEKTVNETLSLRNSIDPLYIIHTSGTTGIPKGVTIANHSVIDYIDWAIETYKVTDAEIIGNQAPLFFDNSVLDLYLTFAKGCTLHLLAKDVLRFPADFGKYFTTHKINFIFFVPSVLGNLTALNIFDSYDLTCIKKILFAGEPMPLSTLKILRDKLPDTLLSNLYGPTEITVDAIYWVFGDEVESLTFVPLGVPCSNHRIIFLDENEQPVTADDEIAEICVSGPGVALGYWNNLKSTNRVFIANPEPSTSGEIIYKTGDMGYKSEKDGLIYMAGRKDNQFKYQGYRIESGEIENALNSLDLIKQSYVIYESDKKLILAFYVPHQTGESSPPFRRLLVDLLPRYMIPHRFFPLDQLPLTSNGKIDREKLRQEYF